MGHKSSNHSESPVRGQASPHRKSMSRRQRSPPAPHRSSHRDGSPARGKHSSRVLKNEMSPSPSPPARKKSLQRDESPRVREKNSGLCKSPRRGKSISPSPPPSWRKSSQRDSSLVLREKNSTHAKSPRQETSRSPSPRTKRLRRAQVERKVEEVTERDNERNHIKVGERSSHKEREAAKMAERERERNHGRGVDRGTRREREAEKLVEREYERNHGRSSDKNAIREIGVDREAGGERRERSSGGHDIDGKSSRVRHGRSASPSDRHHRSKHRSPSPERAIDTRERGEVTNSRAERRNGDDDSLDKMKAVEETLDSKKQKPSFDLSGKLASETNRVRGVTLLFTEPPDARKPDIRWRLYVFKGGEVLSEPLYIHRQSCYLFGRERRVADIPTDHPSCSKQHAVIQFRQVEKEQPDGMLSKEVRPYLMDLGSTNKTFINDNPIEPQRYYELFEKDTIKFGNSR
uniref:FHA domain-containing protein n=1 Tax=Rhizophora mucronata TaxID=61149 RepID=A0A2P2K8X5_RHIMU